MLLHRRGEKEFKLRTEWGRVGAKGACNEENFDNRIDAIVAFKQKFADKTHQDWEKRNLRGGGFKPQPGKYTLVNIAGGGGGASSAQGGADLVAKLNARNAQIERRIRECPTNLDPRTRALLEALWDVKRVQKTLKELNFDVEKCPLGRLQSDQIQKGYRILAEVAHALAQGARATAITELSNQFYSNIPQSYGYQRPPAINTLQRVRDKAYLLDVLRDIDVTSKFFAMLEEKDQSAEGAAAATNPLDFFLAKMKCKITPVSSTAEVWGLV